jgi:hypothetical protein
MRGENETARHCTDLQAAEEMARIQGRLSRFLSAAERAVGAQHVLTDAATREHGIALVPRAGDISYALGAVPVDGAVIVEMARMNRVIQLDTANRHLTVESGIA